MIEELPEQQLDPPANVIYVEDLEKEAEEALVESASSGRGRIEEPPLVNDMDELIARAREADIGDVEISRRGGWRANENRKAYWLDLRQLCEWEEADKTIPLDKDFWAWSRKFLLDEGITGGKGKGWASWKDQAGSWYDKNKNTNYLNKWWGDFGYSGTSELAKKLAIALKAVNTTVGVINTTGNRYRVEFADDTNENQTSYTDFEDRKIVVSPQPLLDSGIKQDDAIEIETGYGLHEASHVQYTDPIKDVMLKPTELEPLAVVQRLFNIIEDERIEGLTGDKFPGFAPYFDKMLEYLWGKSKKVVPTEWGPGIWDKVNVILASVRWPEHYEEIAEKDPELKAQFDWCQQWRDRYLDDSITPRQALVEVLMHLKEDPETAEQLEQQAAKEKQQMSGAGEDPMTMNDKEFGEFLKWLEEAAGQDPNKKIETCPSPQVGQTKEIKLTPGQAEQMKQLVSWELDMKDPVVKMRDMYGGAAGPAIAWLKPDLDQNARDAYRAPSDLVAKMKSAFFFRKSSPQWSERLLKSGAIDEEEIWRFGAQDYRIFEQKKTIDTPETQVTLLVDMSGSMNGVRIETAYELANTMLACLSTMRGIRVKVRGHTTRHETDSAGGEATIYRLWEQGDPVERLGLIDTLPHGWNYDGFAIDAICDEMLSDSRAGEDSVVFVLSDGKPNARGFRYSGTPAMDHVREVVTHYKRLGVTIIQIAIDPEMRSEDQARMYEHWIPFSRREDLPSDLTRMLIKLFGGE
jgi:hypothetical protein